MEGDEPSLVEALTTTALLPFRILTSNTAKRTYIRTILISFAAFFLALLAGAAYVILYATYIPQLGFARPIHLQYESPAAVKYEYVPQPWGTAEIAKGELIAGQPYEIYIHLHMPRAPVNTDAGNFMIDLQLLGSPTTGATDASGKLGTVAPSMLQALVKEARPLIARSSRPAIMRYVSPMVETASKAAAIGWHVAGWRQESDWIHATLFEGVRFAKSSEVPRLARVEIRSEAQLWVYESRIEFRARFGGLRWLMYNHRIISFALFTTLFWLVEMGATLFIWLVCSYAFASAADPEISTSAVKKNADEPIEELSDTSRQFPTGSRSPPLRYSSTALKTEDEGAPTVKLEEVEPMLSTEPNLEADDEEDEDADFVMDTLTGTAAGGRSDSGLGTSYESSAAGDAMRRRKRIL